MSSDDDRPLPAEKKVKKRKPKYKTSARRPRYSKFADMHAKEGMEGQTASEDSVSEDDRHLSDLSCVVSNDVDNSYDDDMMAIYAQSLCSQASNLGFGTPIHKRRNKDKGDCAGSIFTGIVDKHDRKHQRRLKKKADHVLDLNIVDHVLDLNILRSPCKLSNSSLSLHPLQRSPFRRPPDLMNPLGILPSLSSSNHEFQFSSSSTHEEMFRGNIVAPKTSNRMKLRKSSDHIGNCNSIITPPQLDSLAYLSTPPKAKPPAQCDTLPQPTPSMKRSSPSQASPSLLRKGDDGVTSPPSRVHGKVAALPIPTDRRSSPSQASPSLLRKGDDGVTSPPCSSPSQAKKIITISSDSSDDDAAASFRDAASQTSPIEQILTLQDLQRELKEFAKAFGF